MSYDTRTLRKSSAVMSYYLYLTSGSDSNNGLSWATAWKTPNYAMSRIPDQLGHNTVLNVIGTYAATDWKIDKQILSGATLLIDGGLSNKTTIYSGTVGAGSTTASLVDGVGGFVTDAYAGYFLEILTGGGANNTRTIQRNAAGTVSPCRLFSAAPTNGGTYHTYRPTTSVGGVTLAGNGGGTLIFQNFYLSATVGLILVTSQCQQCQIGSVVYNSDASSAFSFQALGAVQFGITATNYNPTTLTTLPAATYATGLGAPNKGQFRAAAGSTIQALPTTVIGAVTCTSSFLNLGLLSNGTRVRGPIILFGTQPGSSTGFTFNSATATYNSISIDGVTGVGFKAQGSTINQSGALDISNCTSHGIELINSTFTQTGTLTGTGNTGAGAYVHANSVFFTKSGTPPTLTGGVGDLAVDDPATQQSTWAAIEAGTPVASANEFSIVKKV